MTIPDKKITKSIFIKNMFWKFGERAGSQTVAFIVSVVIARILMPEEYGLIAMVLVFTNIAGTFVTAGIGQSLIQKKDADNLDFSSIFFLNIGLSILLYAIVFFAAPGVARFYNNEILTPIMRVLGITLMPAAINSVLGAYVARNMMFKRSFYSNLVGVLASGIVGIVMAYQGFGVWALVAQNIIVMYVNIIVLWFIVKWRPEWKFSGKRAARLFSFGWKIQLSGILTVFSSQLRNLVIGKLYSSVDLAYYQRGLTFPRLISNNLIVPISAVFFPVISQAQNDKIRLKELTRKYVRVTSYIVFPLMAGLAAAARPLVDVLLTAKWLPAVPFLQISCFSFAIIIIQMAIQDAINALGRSDIYLYMDLVRKVIGLSIVFMVMKQGVMAIALSVFIVAPISIFMVMEVSRRLIDYRYKEHFLDNFPLLFASLAMASVVYLVQLLGFSSLITLSLQIVTGVTIYYTLSRLFKFEGYLLVLEYLLMFKSKVVG
jgi:O-antigen/teichoic acid export membrane protein